ncbi:MAG TPA: DUF748 domain-containing protein [Desulfuromonadales bacterium]|nr:DUF748 domain-containing protein [Desulfuromonadales bacterium]
MSTKKKVAVICASVSSALLLFSLFLLPLIVRNQAVKILKETTGRKVQIKTVAINPFTLTVTISGVRVEDPAATAPLLVLDSLRVSLSSASLFRRALIIDEFAIDAPAISFARRAANTYSFTDIIERQKAKPQQKSEGTFRFSINNISINNGSIDFDDQATVSGKLHTVRNLMVTLPFISNIPYLAESSTDPKLSAVINGAPFSFGGKVKPFSRSRETSVTLKIDQLELPRYMAYLPGKVPVGLSTGTLTTDCQINYKISADTRPELTISGLLKLNSLQANWSDGTPLLKLPALQVKAARLAVFARQFDFDAILLDGLELFASRDKKGIWMYSRLLPTTPQTLPPQPSVPQKSAEKNKSPGFSVAKLVLNGAALHFSDALPPGGFTAIVSDIDLTATDLSNATSKLAAYELSMLIDNQATLTSDGNLSLIPLTATASAELSNLGLQKAWPYLAQFLTAPVTGNLSAAVEATYTKENGVTVSNGTLEVSGLSAHYGSKEGFELALLRVAGACFSQKENRAGIDDIQLSKGSIALSKEADGRISLLSLLRNNTAAAAPAKTAVSNRPAAVKKPLTWDLKQFRLDRCNASFTDKSREEKPYFTLTNSTISLSNLQGPNFKPARLKFTGTLNKATPLKASGLLTPLPFRYMGDINVRSLQIRDFEDYFPDELNVFVLSGAFDSAMSVDISLKEGKPVGSFSGSSGIRSFHTVDAVAEEDLLKWESLQLDRIQGTLEPFSLSIAEVALNNIYSRIVVRKDGTLNLQNLMAQPKGQGARDKRQEEGVTEQGSKEIILKTEAIALTGGVKNDGSPTGTKAAIKIGKVSVQAGTIAFSDRHLPQTFNSTFYNLGGRVSGLSSETATLAEVDLRGNLENHSPLQITGKINPLRDDLFVDLKVAFTDIDLSPVTPYSSTYLGYTVEKGKLFLNLKYLIDKKTLTSENRVFIDQFTFGEKVASEKATSLPVRLAVALLKDRKGEIHLDLPVTGRTDDPTFSVWGVVWQVFKNLIVKAATSPFALLSSMAGNGQDFSSIPFEHGRSVITLNEQQKLSALAKVLADRPGIKMEIKGYVEREKDAEGFRREQLQQKLRSEKFLLLARNRQLKEGVTAAEMQILPEETSALLTSVYKKEKFPKPRNAVGLVKELPDDEMRKLIIANIVVGDQELQGLAHERSTAVINYLVTKGGLPAQRLFQKNDDILKAPATEGAVRSRVEFNAIAQ